MSTMTDDETKERALLIVAKAIHGRFTPELIESLKKPGHLDWFEALINGVFDRIDGTLSKPKSSIVA
jgi:hypothetical protein